MWDTGACSSHQQLVAAHPQDAFPSLQQERLNKTEHIILQKFLLVSQNLSWSVGLLRKLEANDGLRFKIVSLLQFH